MAAQKENYQVRAVRRATEILGAFSVQEPEFTLLELSKKLGYHKSTLLRILRCMEALRFIEHDHETGRYRLGIRTFEVGSVYYVLHLRVEHVARPYTEDLARKWNLTANLAVLDRGEIVYVGIVEPRGPLRIANSVGSRLPIHVTALGKALAAGLTDEEVDYILSVRGMPSYTPNSITSPVRFKQELGKVREAGYALDDQEVINGVRCVAGPIRDHRGRTVAALSVSGSIVDLTDEVIPEVARDVVETANRISERLGSEVAPLYAATAAPARVLGV